jgi:hypothetical protein
MQSLSPYSVSTQQVRPWQAGAATSAITSVEVAAQIVGKVDCEYCNTPFTTRGMKVHHNACKEKTLYDRQLAARQAQQASLNLARMYAYQDPQGNKSAPQVVSSGNEFRALLLQRIPMPPPQTVEAIQQFLIQLRNDVVTSPQHQFREAGKLMAGIEIEVDVTGLHNGFDMVQTFRDQVECAEIGLRTALSQGLLHGSREWLALATEYGIFSNEVCLAAYQKLPLRD